MLAACFGLGIIPIPANAALITATSTRATCDWVDPSCWLFDPVQPAPVAPQNDATNYFTIQIDGGSATNSRVDLAAAMTVDRVEIASGDTLRLLDGAFLKLQYDAGRVGSAGLRNDGTLALGSSQTGARLEFSAPYSENAIPKVEITGAGAIELSDHVGNYIGAPDFNFRATLDVALGTQQILRGAGTIQFATNRGTIEATGTQPLVLTGVGLFSRFSNEGTLRAIGSGGLVGASYDTEIVNSGLIEIEAGSRLVGRELGFISGEVRNTGTLRVRGDADPGTLYNSGLVEILDGGTLSASIDQDSSGALIRVGSGSTLDAGQVDISSGRVRIEDAVVRGFGLNFVGASASTTRLEGTGRVEGGLLFRAATLATGLDGVGRIDVEGNVQFLDRGIWQVDLGADDHDALTVSGTTSFGGPNFLSPAARIDLAFQTGFAPTAGDRLDILSSGSITTHPSVGFKDLFRSPDLPGDFYFAPEIAQEGAQQRLSLHVLTPIVARWVGGDGNYQDAASWSFSRPPTASIPGNAGIEIFDVQISGSPGAPATVRIANPTPIDRLTVGALNTLILDANPVLLEQPLGRSEAREVVNDGTIELRAASLTSENDLVFRGSGIVRLTDDASNLIGDVVDATDFTPIDFSNGAGHTIAGAGAIRTTSSVFATSDRGELSNAGTIEATGSNPLLLDGHVVNTGNLIASGPGGFRIGGNLTQRGLLQLGAGSRLELGTFNRQFVQEGDTAVTELGAGAVLISDFINVNGGRISLDGGTIRTDRSPGASVSNTLLKIGAGGLLEGNGLIHLPDPVFSSLRIDPGGALAPGRSGIGLLRIEGGLDLDGVLRVDLAGTDPQLHDRIDATSTAAFRGTVAVSLLDGFAPAHGDVFEIVRAAQANVRPEIEGGAIGGGLFLVPDLRNDAGSGTLSLRTKREVVATWSGANGDFRAPTWTFSAPPISATTPNNDDWDIFDVEIGATGPAHLTLGSPVQIESLTVAEGSSLDLATGSELTVIGTSERARSGRIANDGTIVIGTDAASATIDFAGDLAITGHGTIEVGASSVIAANYFAGELTNGADHTIRGSGRIGSAIGVHNLGLIEATGTSRMFLTRVVNEGTLRSSGAGGMSIAGTNRGRIEVLSGSSFSALGVINEGEVDVSGSLTASITNLDRIDVHTGATYAGNLRQTSPQAVTHVAGNLVAARFNQLVFESGTLDLDGGSVGFSELGLWIGRDAVLMGDGAIAKATTLAGGQLQIDGKLAPGHGGVGSLALTGSMLLSPTGTFSIELSGTGAAEHDLVTVLGSSVLEGTIVVATLETGLSAGLFAPALGDAFDILIAQSIAAAEASFVLPALSGNLGWVTGIVAVDGMQRLRLLVVPEPGSAALLLFGLVLLARRKTRRVH